MDPAGTILVANRKTAEAYRTPMAELLGKRVYDLIPPTLARLSRAKASEAVRTKQSVHFEAKWRGTFFDHHLYPVIEDGTVTKLGVWVRDVTHRKEMEAAIQQAEQKYRNIFENATEGIFQTTPQGRFMSANPSLAKVHGYDSPEELMSSITNIGTQLYVDRERRLELIRLLKKQDVIRDFEARMRRKDGAIQWISINIRAVRDKKRRLLYYEGTMQDVTKRKEAEAALAESEERYRTAIEHSNDGVAIIQGDIHKYVNNRFVSMFGYTTPAEIEGKSIFLLVQPEDRPYVKEINMRRRRGESVPQRYEFRGLTRNGGLIYVEVSAAEIAFRNGRAILVYLRDITARKLAEEALLRSHKELEQLNRVKTRAVHHVAHELKTPLAVIKGNVRLLRHRIAKRSKKATIEGVLDNLERNVERLMEVQRETDDIFRASQEVEASVVHDDLDRLRQRMEDFSELSPEIRAHWEALKEWIDQYISTEPVVFQTIDLSPFVTQAVERARTLASHRQIEFRVEGENDLYIFMDPAVLRETLDGLIRNAIENTPDGGRIDLVIEEKGNRILVHVTDFGIGINEESQKFIFDGLFHATSTDLYSSKRPYEFGAGGKGLDLLRMKVYARRFGFDLDLKSSRCTWLPTDNDICPGDIALCNHCTGQEDCLRSGGTTFTLSFPAEKRDIPPSALNPPLA